MLKLAALGLIISSTCGILSEDISSYDWEVENRVREKCQLNDTAEANVCVEMQEKIIDFKNDVGNRLGMNLGPQRYPEHPRPMPDLMDSAIRHRFMNYRYDREYNELINIDDTTVTKPIYVEQSPSHLPTDSKRTFFDVTNIPDSADVILSFFIDNEVVPRGAGSFSYHYHVYKYITPTDVAMVPVLSNSGKWSTYKVLEEVNVTDIVRNWKKNNAENFGIMIKLITEYENDFVYRSNAGNIKMLATAKFPKEDDNGLALPTGNPYTVRPCGFRTMEVSFEEDFGWNWVLAPKKIDVGFCGRQSDSRMMDSLPLIYVNQKGSVRTVNVPLVIVTSCSCG